MAKKVNSKTIQFTYVGIVIADDGTAAFMQMGYYDM
ncbi:hypothetical protein M2092_001512 [Fusobacterium sp. PH5-44]